MADVKLSYPSSVYIPVSPGDCLTVYLCISSEARGETVSGRAFIEATIQNTGRYLGTAGMPVPPSFSNPRGQEVYQYSLVYDSAQFTDPAYRLNCEDILGIFPHSCTLEEVLRIIDDQTDWVVDSANVTQTVDQGAGQFDVTIPIIDRVDSVSVGSFTLTLGALFDDTASDLSAYDTPAGGYTFTKAAVLGGGTETIQVISQDADNAISAGSDNGAFLCSLDQSYDTDIESAVATTDISVVGTYTIVEGTEITINNPSSCRSMLVWIAGDHDMQATLLATGVWEVRVEENINGGGYSSVNTKQYGAYGSDVAIPMLAPYVSLFTIAAGGSLTYQKRMVVETIISTGATSSIDSYTMTSKILKLAGA